ncbi:unnamed protein product [Linum tenue]|uniref:Uncharacterized protein n=1 Tax=Linum tenue TaxID=586396 RepID=A0AAV0J528_9ROSI|nr:unnamed protein product [Linum tenue]
MAGHTSKVSVFIRVLLVTIFTALLLTSPAAVTSSRHLPATAAGSTTFVTLRSSRAINYVGGGGDRGFRGVFFLNNKLNSGREPNRGGFNEPNPSAGG